MLRLHLLLLIRLVPYWNVKQKTNKENLGGYTIRLVPYWNVKGEYIHVLPFKTEIRLVPYWNVKFISPSFPLQGFLIRLVPYWNVKSECIMSSDSIA